MPGHFDGRNSFYFGEFDDSMEELILPFTSAIRQQAELNDGRVDLYINSYGGAAHVLMQFIELVEVAKRDEVTVRTIVTNTAYSAGSMLAVAGTPGERYIGRNAFHLAHYGSTGGSPETTPTQTKRNHDFNQVLFKQVVNHYNKYCSIPNLEANLLDDNWFIKATDAKRWGMADHFLDKFELLW